MKKTYQKPAVVKKEQNHVGASACGKCANCGQQVRYGY